MATPGDLSSKKVKNTYKGIVQYSGGNHRIYDGTGSRVTDLDVTRVTASRLKIGNIDDLSVLQLDGHLGVSGSTKLGDNSGTDTVKIVGDTWITGSFTVSQSSTFRNIGQAKFIYKTQPEIENQKPARVNRGFIRGQYNVPRFGGENAALDVYGNAVITGSLIVSDTVFAQEFHSEVVSQSIIYTSGSTKFGADFADTMTVTGSIFQSGSDSYFLNGIGLGTSGSKKSGVPNYNEPGQDSPVYFSHLLRIDDAGHDALQHKNGKLIYGTYGTKTHQKGLAHVSSSDTVRFRDSAKTEDVFVISAISQSVFITNESDVYNVAIGAPSRSLKIDEKLVVSSSKDTRVKIESATGVKSASLYLESGKGVWEIAAASSSTGPNNQFSESLVFRTNTSKNNLDLWAGNGTYTEALRLDNEGRAGFAIPSINAYQYPQQVQVSGSLNIIQGRTISINAGTFHDSDGMNGIYFNNQKMIYVSGSGINSNYYFGIQAGNSTGTTGADGASANIGIGYQALQDITIGDDNVAIGHGAAKNLTTGLGNISVGSGSMGLGVVTGIDNIALGNNALFDLTSGGNNIAIGSGSMANATNNIGNVAIGWEAMRDSANDGDYNIAIGYQAMYNGDVSGTDNIGMGGGALGALTYGFSNIAIGKGSGDAITGGNHNILLGRYSGTDVTFGAYNIALGDNAMFDLTVGDHNIALGFTALGSATSTDIQANIAIGKESMKDGIVTGDNNTGLGASSLRNLTSGTENIAVGTSALRDLTTGRRNIAIGSGSMSEGTVTGEDNIAVGTFALEDATKASGSIAIGYRAATNLTVAMGNIAIGSGSMGKGTVTGVAGTGYSHNVAIGTYANEDLTTGTQNVSIGYKAAANLTTGTDNIAIGPDAMANAVVSGDRNIGIGKFTLHDLTSGDGNIALGRSAGKSFTDNIHNIAIGQHALYTSANDGDQNIAIGFWAMKSGDVSGHRNIGLGISALKDLTTGTDNIGIGSTAAYNLTTGKGNIAVGSGSMGLGNVSGVDNIAIGSKALLDLTTGGNNIAIGSGSAANMTNNKGNIALGWESLQGSVNDGDGNVAIGYKAIKNGDVSGNRNIGIGYQVLDDLTSGNDNVVIGTNAAIKVTNNTDNVVIGVDAFAASANDGDTNIAIGKGAMKTGDVSGDNNIGIGELTLEDLTSGTDNIAIGSGAALQVTNNTDNVAIGHDAFAASVNDGDKNVAIGFSAMKSGDVSGDNNIAIGINALDNLTSGTDNIAIGSDAGDGTTIASNTIAIGHDAMSAAATTGDGNIAIGTRALDNVVGATHNIAIGFSALRDVSNSADKNIAIGYQVAFDGVLTGDKNIIIGNNAANRSTSLYDNIIIGRKAASEAVGASHRNIIMGVSSSAKITTGEDNIVVGSDAGNAVTTNTKNILIGSGSSAAAGLANAYTIGTQASVTQADSLVLGGQTGKRFRTGIGGMTAPNSTLEVSGTVNFTGSALFSGSSYTGNSNQAGHNEGWTLKTIGTVVMSASKNPNSRYNPMRALEVSGTANFHGNQYITGNLFVSDIIVAQEFHTEYVSASISFTSGSNKMGDSSDDEQQMSGSLRVTGSGVHYYMGRQRGGAILTTDHAKLGINTMLPTYEFDVVGNIGIGSGSAEATSNARAAYSYIYHNDDVDTNIKLSTNRLQLTAGGYTVAITGSEGTADPNTVVVNEGGKNLDFRIEGTNHTHLFFVSGGSNQDSGYGGEGLGAVGIKTSNPTKALTVSGSISGSADLFIEGNSIFGTSTVIISGSGRITSSNNLWVSNSAAYVSASSLKASNDVNVGGNLLPLNNDGGTIGNSSLQWSDVFLAEGAVINFDNGDVTVTQTGNLLDIDGGNTRVDRLEIDSANDYIDVDTDLKIIAAADIVLDAGGNNVKPGSDSADSLGVAGTQWHTVFTDNVNLDGQGRLDLDDDQDTSIRASGDDIITFEAAAADQLHINDGTFYPEATNDIDLGKSAAYFHNAFVTNVTSSFISASTMIFTEGTVSASIVSASYGYFSNIEVTGSATSTAPQGTGSFGRINADVVMIHNHEIVGGSGLSVSGSITNLGSPGRNDQPVVITGNVTASNIWVSGSTIAQGGGGHISASSMTLTNDLIIMGNISGSYISASKGFHTAGDVTASSILATSRIHSNFITGSWITGSHGFFTHGKIIAAGSMSCSRIRTKQINTGNTNAGLTIIGNVTASGEISSSGNIRINSGSALYTDKIDFSTNMSTNTEQNFISVLKSDTHQSSKDGRLVVQSQFQLNLSSSAVRIDHDDDNSLTIGSNGGTDPNLIFRSDYSKASPPTTDPNAQVIYYDDSYTQPGLVFLGRAKSSTQYVFERITANGSGSADLIAINEASTSYSQRRTRFRIDYNGNTYMPSGSLYVGSTSVISHITASGNISSSGYIIGNHITASGNISSSNSLIINQVTASSTISGSKLLSSGNVVASGSLIGTNYRSFYIAAAGMTPSVTNGATAATIERPGEAGTGNTYHSIDYLAFDEGTNEYANFQIPMPDEWDRGTVKAKFYWHSSDDGSSNETVIWGMNATSINTSGDMSAAASSFTDVTDIVPINDGKLNISQATTAITVAGTHASSSLVFFRVQRNASGDTYDSDAHLLGVALQYRERAHAEIGW